MKKLLSTLLLVAMVLSLCSVSVFADETVRYEAEDAVIAEGKNAEIRDAAGNNPGAVSGGKFVGGFDDQADVITFTVNVPADGTYTMTIGYVSADTRSFDITVNGELTEDYAFTEKTGDWWGDTKTYTMEVTLKKGDNTIVFGQKGAWAPSLDYIEFTIPTATTPDPKPETTPDVPETGDMLSISIGLAVIALAGAAAVTSKKRIAE